jgi:T-lymphoma invasion and metastasis-inducing protein 1
MADLQSSVVTDQDTRLQIQQQIITWEENLERLHCEQFRLRCYMASLQCGELPNPKVIICDCWPTNFLNVENNNFSFITYSRF